MLPAILGGVGVAGAATIAGYHTMSPTSQIYGRTFTGVEPGSRLVALTYDDGPNEPYTSQVLNVLERHGAKATFFLIGKFVRQRPDLARAVVAAGHAIGSHTWDHPNLVLTSHSELRRQLEQARSAILEATGIVPKLFRPPFGGRRPATLRAVREIGLQTIMWSVTCYDWRATSADKIVRHAERQIRGGDVILLHDGGHRAIGADRSRTVEATDRLLKRYRGEGYEFVTIPEMMAKALTRN
jgi:peptidoglycan/xylan/chitin deacetylase (PgdA/CDA1 family)